MKAGEIWEIEKNNGTTAEVVILAAHEGYCTVLSLTDFDSGYPVISKEQKFTDVGRMQYAFNDTFTFFIKVMNDKAFDDLMAAVADGLGIKQKIIEVPVEKVVEVAAPVQYVDNVGELTKAKAEAEIYKGLYEQLLVKMLG